MKEIKLFTDGGSRGNPGPGAIGILVLDAMEQELERHAEFIGHTTNNRAEYRALIKGLDVSTKHTRSKVTCYTDSEVMCMQLNGEYRLRNDELRNLFRKVKKAAQAFDEVIYIHVSRANPLMKKVDRMLNEALNRAMR